MSAVMDNQNHRKLDLHEVLTWMEQDFMQIQLAMPSVVYHCIHRGNRVSLSGLIRRSAIRQIRPEYSTIFRLFPLY